MSIDQIQNNKVNLLRNPSRKLKNKKAEKKVAHSQSTSKPASQPALSSLERAVKKAQWAIKNAIRQREYYFLFVNVLAGLEKFNFVTGKKENIFTSQQINQAKAQMDNSLREEIANLRNILAKANKTEEKIKEAYTALQYQVSNIYRGRTNIELFLERYTQYERIAERAFEVYFIYTIFDPQLAVEIKTAHDKFFQETKIMTDAYYESKENLEEKIFPRG